ncbi:MAG TPA: GNAT family protein [Verrucomicrobiae bacterium]
MPADARLKKGKMQHSIKAEGFGVRMRPVELDDAEFIVCLRKQRHARGNIGDSALDVPSQQRWLDEYFRRPGDYYFVVESPSGSRVGTFGIYHADQTSAEAGRWIIVPAVPAAVPSAILAGVVAFDILKLARFYSKVVSTNQRIIALDEKLGMHQTHIERAGLRIAGQPTDLIHLVCEADEWPTNYQRLRPFCEVAERRMRAWDRAHYGWEVPD